MKNTNIIFTITLMLVLCCFFQANIVYSLEGYEKTEYLENNSKYIPTQYDNDPNIDSEHQELTDEEKELMAQGVGLFVGMVGLFWIMWVSFILVISIVSIGGAILWVFMLIDCAHRDTFKTKQEKTTWIVVLALTSWVGAIIYYFFVKKKNNKIKKQNNN